MDGIYDYLDGDGQVLVEDRDIAKTFNDLLEAWLKATKYLIKKENLALEVVRAQKDFFERSGGNGGYTYYGIDKSDRPGSWQDSLSRSYKCSRNLVG